MLLAFCLVYNIIIIIDEAFAKELLTLATEDEGKKENENDTINSKIWQKNDALSLISRYEQHVEDFTSAKKKRQVWQHISNELLSDGVIVC